MKEKTINPKIFPTGYMQTSFSLQPISNYVPLLTLISILSVALPNNSWEEIAIVQLTMS